MQQILLAFSKTNIWENKRDEWQCDEEGADMEIANLHNPAEELWKKGKRGTLGQRGGLRLGALQDQLLMVLLTLLLLGVGALCVLTPTDTLRKELKLRPWRFLGLITAIKCIKGLRIEFPTGFPSSLSVICWLAFQVEIHWGKPISAYCLNEEWQTVYSYVEFLLPLPPLASLQQHFDNSLCGFHLLQNVSKSLHFLLPLVLLCPWEQLQVFSFSLRTPLFLSSRSPLWIYSILFSVKWYWTTLTDFQNKRNIFKLSIIIVWHVNANKIMILACWNQEDKS